MYHTCTTTVDIVIIDLCHFLCVELTRRVNSSKWVPPFDERKDHCCKVFITWDCLLAYFRSPPGLQVNEKFKNLP